MLHNFLRLNTAFLQHFKATLPNRNLSNALVKPVRPTFQRLFDKQNGISCFHKKVWGLTRSINTTQKTVNLKKPSLEFKTADVSRLVSLAKSERWVLLLAMGCLVVSSAVTMSVPFALGKIVDTIFNKENTSEKTMSQLKILTAALCGIFVIGGLANAARVYLFNSASLRIVQQVRSKTYKKVLEQETGWFDTKGSGELVNRLINDTHFIGNSLSQNLSDGMRSLVMLGSGAGMMTGLSGNIIIVSVLYYGGILVVNGELSVGALTSFILYAAYSAVAINGISNFYSELNKGIGAGQRLWEIFDRQPAIISNLKTFPTEKPRGEILFKDVNFSFPARPESQVLKNFNLLLLPGQTTAVVGRSGTGKTTIASLLMRLYDPQSGRIFLDGTNLRDLDPLYLRKHISAVSQEPILFSGSIRDNILYGLNPNETITDAAFEDIICKANVKEFVSTLKDNLETTVGQRGIMLSGGQKQRVAIARALIKNPSILILDEATSALDAVSEELVQNALDHLVKGRTVLTIAHRLSTIRNADKIAVLENGQIIEEGSYEMLMHGGGVFRDLISKQIFSQKKVAAI